MRIGIIDYGAGNLRSVQNALAACGAADVAVVSSPVELTDCAKIILPGVGAFPRAMERLSLAGFPEALHRHVRERGKLFLGICLGMQLLLDYSLELGRTAGLGWIPGSVRRFPEIPGLAVPHMGWNDTRPAVDAPLWTGIPQDADFYYVHSYYVDCAEPSDVLARCEYGVPFAAAVARGNVYGVQFHPEKSQTGGMRLLRNFVELPC